MTIEVFPDSPPLGLSPRISFSHDLNQSDVVPVEEYIRSTSSSTIDFDFCVFRESFSQESSTADELFFNGQILPIQINRRLSPPPPPTPPLTPDDEFPQPMMRSSATTTMMRRPPPPLPPPKPRTSGESKVSAADSTEEIKPKSFWRFKRSASLNCGSGYGTLCPLPLLSRSNSTGSSTGGKRSAVTNSGKQGFLRQQSSNTVVKHNYSNQSTPAYSGGRPPLKRSGHGYPGNGVKFNPVLHVPSANLFGLGSIFSIGGAGKERSRKKN